MIIDVPSTCMRLAPGQVARLQLRAGTRLRGERGTTWLTADGDTRDVLLDPDDTWVLERDRQVLACALHAQGEATLCIEAPARGAR